MLRVFRLTRIHKTQIHTLDRLCICGKVWYGYTWIHGFTLLIFVSKSTLPPVKTTKQYVETQKINGSNEITNNGDAQGAAIKKNASQQDVRHCEVSFLCAKKRQTATILNPRGETGDSQQTFNKQFNNSNRRKLKY